jgi:Rod binding domain-containing protein
VSLPPIDQATLPADIRNGSKQDKQAYTAALGFEQMLVQQLTKSLASSAMGTDSTDDGSSDDGSSGDSGSTDSGASMYTDMISSSLADGIAQQGGLGLANSLYQSLGMEQSS